MSPSGFAAVSRTLTVLAVLLASSVATAHPLEGRDAPPIRAQYLTGQPFDLAKVEASVIVLDFWATWCPPCRKGLPLLQQYQDWAQQNKKSVAVFAVNLREDPRKVRSYWKREKFRMPVVMDSDGQIGKSYAVRGIPQTVVIHNNKVVRVHVGYIPTMTDILKAETERLLGESDQ